MPARWLGRLFAPLLGRRMRARVDLRLRRAEVDGAMSAEDWLGLCIGNALGAASIAT